MAQPPRTYDEIVRSTVPEPDSSFRPTPEQVKQAHEGFRALDTDEQTLHDRVHAAVGAGVTIEIDRTRVILRGHVASSQLYQSIEDRARAVEGVGAVQNDLVIGG